MSKVIVYIKANLDLFSELENLKKTAIKFCEFNEYEIDEIVIDNLNEDSFEEVMDYCMQKQNGIYNIVTINLNMVGRDIYETYDRFIYLDNYCHCNLISIEDKNYSFKIELERGENYE